VIVFNSPNSDPDERSRALPRTSRFRTHEFEEVERAEPIVSTRHSRFGSDTTQDSDVLDIA